MTPPTHKTVEPFVPLPDPWPEVPVCILGMFTSCEDCCTAATGGDLCGPCDLEYKRIANFLRPYIQATVRECARAAALSVPGHYVAGLAEAAIFRRFPEALTVNEKEE